LKDIRQRRHRKKRLTLIETQEILYGNEEVHVEESKIHEIRKTTLR
jgi:hypothetical protein